MSSTGSAIGTGIGTVAGAYFGGPIGAGLGGTLGGTIGGMFGGGGNSAQEAADAQARVQMAALAQQQAQWQAQQNRTQPYVALGEKAANKLSNYNFNVPTYDASVMSPMNEWEKGGYTNTPAAINKNRALGDAMNARGTNYGQVGANAQAAQYGANYDAERAYQLGNLQNAYKARLGEWQVPYDMLTNQSTMGLNAVSGLGGLGAQYASMGTQALTNLGNAQANGILGSAIQDQQKANTITNLPSQLFSSYLGGMGGGGQTQSWWGNSAQPAAGGIQSGVTGNTYKGLSFL